MIGLSLFSDSFSYKSTWVWRSNWLYNTVWWGLWVGTVQRSQGFRIYNRLPQNYCDTFETTKWSWVSKHMPWQPLHKHYSKNIYYVRWRREALHVFLFHNCLVVFIFNLLEEMLRRKLPKFNTRKIYIKRTLEEKLARSNKKKTWEENKQRNKSVLKNKFHHRDSTWLTEFEFDLRVSR